MKYRSILPIVSAALLAAGCKPTSDTEPSSPLSTNAPDSTRLEQMKKETKDTVLATRDYAYAQKAEFAEKIRGELADLNQKIDDLSAKIENSTADTRAEAKEKLAAMREKANHLNEQLDQVKDSTETKWEETKAGIQKGWNELKDSVDQSRQWLADKIAPGK